METIFLIVSLCYLAIIVFLSITWYKDVARKEDTDKRILVLEKRDAEKLDKEDFNNTLDFIFDACKQQDILIHSINKRVEKLEKRLPKNNK